MVFSCTCIFIVKSLTLQSEMSTPPEKISPRPHTCTCIFSYDHKTCYNSNIEECDTYVYTHQAHENKYK